MTMKFGGQEIEHHKFQFLFYYVLFSLLVQGFFFSLSVFLSCPVIVGLRPSRLPSMKIEVFVYPNLVVIEEFLVQSSISSISFRVHILGLPFRNSKSSSTFIERCQPFVYFSYFLLGIHLVWLQPRESKFQSIQVHSIFILFYFFFILGSPHLCLTFPFRIYQSVRFCETL